MGNIKNAMSKKYVSISLLIVALLFIALLIISTSTGEYKRTDEFVQEPFVSGNELTIPVSCYASSGPTKYFFSTKLTEGQVLDKIRANNDVGQIFKVEDTTLEGNRYLISLNYNGNQNYFSLVSFGTERIGIQSYNRYAISSLAFSFIGGEKNDARYIMFPVFALPLDELSHYPHSIQGDSISIKNVRLTCMIGDQCEIHLFDLLKDFYSYSGVYSLNDDTSPNGFTVEFDPKDAEMAIERENVYTGEFTVQQVAERVYFALSD